MLGSESDRVKGGTFDRPWGGRNPILILDFFGRRCHGFCFK